MTSFGDHFWGEKNNGFFVLNHNMKQGQTSSKEFIDFLRESCSVEETYSKLLNKLAKSVSNNTHAGTFAPFWNVLKTLAEKISTLHVQLVHSLTDLIKDVSRYNDEQSKKSKAVKERESSTLETVNSIQHTTTALHKAKEIYHTRCLELERLKRDGSSQKDIEKAETKYKKASDDYRTLVEKYGNVRNEFETKMMDSCKRFQELEEEHICQMKDFVETFAKAWENEHVMLGQVHQEFRQSCDELTVLKLLETFINSKKTGEEKPGHLGFVEADLSSLPSARPMSPDPNDKRDSISEKSRQDLTLFSDSSGSPSPVPSDQPGPLSRSVKLRVSRTWFLKNKKKKEKKKKKKEKEEKEAQSSDTQSVDTTEGTTPDVDEEGYSIRPEDPMENSCDKNSWSSESDSDSDDESKRKIKVAIRPLSPNGNMSGTVDDIKNSVSQLRLSPTAGLRKRTTTPIDKKMMKRSQSESDTLDPGKPSQDLLNLDFFSSSSASTQSGSRFHLPSPLSPMADSSLQNSTTHSTASTPLNNFNVNDVLNHSNGSQDSSLPGPPPSIPQRPAPQPRTKSIPPQVPSRPISGRSSPANFMSRSESSGSVTFNTTSMPVGSSRGPSPLTIGMSDTIPLAIAFTETISAFFKGTDATRCIVKIAGNVMMSFPAGVVRVFTENPNPALLSFKLKNVSKMENILLNKQLVEQDTSYQEQDTNLYTFNMTALMDHLKHQGEQNKSASYFNIDILKYQVLTQPGVESTPLPVVAYWKCEDDTTDYRLDYKYNPTSMSSRSTLKNVMVTVGVSGGVSNMQSLPSGEWNEENQRATWKLNDLSELSEEGSQGSIRAKFELKSGPSRPSTSAIQFLCEGASLSGLDLELVGPGYRVSLLKKRFGAGKYIVDPDPPV
ncbi:F-BAR domain only protein 2-like isoform X2 [Ostrea edulis]|uniref:F-BAR domain only protein 2-like isoform X2 n=1 Tax=Ostrea edulis TaxID=37623 RepID=UPI0024AE948A|nr:F-BAR domain only protein 2-like isoform X2 [Ostrea edulis]